MAELEGIIARMRATEFRSQATISSQASRSDTTSSCVCQLEQQVQSALAIAFMYTAGRWCEPQFPL